MALRNPATQRQPLLTVDQVADRLNVSRWTVYRLQDDLGSFRVRGAVRFDPERLDRWIRERAAAAEADDSGER